MGKICTQLDFDQRIELSRLDAAGYSRRKIGHLMGRSHTIVQIENGNRYLYYWIMHHARNYYAQMEEFYLSQNGARGMD
ncbi:MAG: helix-turn-helix domain-containing protein [Planctomycetaceae bacterium]|nr:helix-turn-helix domain-containing protein [Planctomycetaceae bacterium]